MEIFLFGLTLAIRKIHICTGTSCQRCCHRPLQTSWACATTLTLHWLWSFLWFSKCVIPIHSFVKCYIRFLSTQLIQKLETETGRILTKRVEGKKKQKARTKLSPAGSAAALTATFWDPPVIRGRTQRDVVTVLPASSGVTYLVYLDAKLSIFPHPALKIKQDTPICWNLNEGGIFWEFYNTFCDNWSHPDV